MEQFQIGVHASHGGGFNLGDDHLLRKRNRQNVKVNRVTVAGNQGANEEKTRMR